MTVINWKIIVLSHASDVVHIIKYNRQKGGQGISQNVIAKKATFMDLIVINRLNNDKI